MFLYGFTLQRASQITLAVHGQFSGTKQQVRNEFRDGAHILLL